MKRAKNITPGTLANAVGKTAGSGAGAAKGSVATTAALARHLGLSRWTVSRVLNGHVGVLPETVERVHRAMAELGFQPNALARSLRGGRSGAIGVCFQELESPLLARKVALLQQALRQRGYRALIELTNGDRELERQAVVHFLSMQVEGMVLIGSQLEQDDPTLAMVLGQKLPIMWIDPENRQKGDQIAIDRVLSMRLVLDHLVALGHKRIGVIGIDPQNPYGAFRIPAIESHAQMRGLDVENDLLIHYHPGHKDHDYAYGEQLTRELLARGGRRPTALIALNDRVAIGALAYLRAVGIDVPGQMSVVGYDNLGVSDYLIPTLTSVDHDAERLMARAAQVLVERIEGRVEGRQTERSVGGSDSGVGSRSGGTTGGATDSETGRGGELCGGIGMDAAQSVQSSQGAVGAERVEGAQSAYNAHSACGGQAGQAGAVASVSTAPASILIEPKLIVRGSTAQAQPAAG